jgi:hypothetical protein
MNSNDADTQAAWQQLAPLLDETVAQLGDADRAVLVLRYYEQHPLEEVGAALDIGADAAQKRVTRALEKLRTLFAKRGLTLSAALIAGAVSANSVQAAPAGMAKIVSIVAATKGAAATASMLTLVQGVLKIMAWSKIKATIGIATATLIAIGTAAAVIATWNKMEGIPASVSNLLQGFNPTNATRSDVDAVNQKIEGVYADFFKNAPTGVFIQATRFKQTAFARHGGNEMIGKMIPFPEMLARAFETNEIAFSTSRIVFNTEVPQGSYDYLVNVPDHGLEKFRDEIQKRFGLIGKIEMCATNALVLRAKTGEPSTPKNVSDYNPEDYYLVFWNSMALANRLGETLGQPVIDGVESKSMYTIALPRKSNDLALLNKILGEQVGLELASTNARIEMLIVGKVK